MSFNNLELEFEDDEEPKKSDALLAKPSTTPTPAPAARPAVAASSVPRPALKAVPASSSAPKVLPTEALKETASTPSSANLMVNELRDEMRRILLESEVRVAVAEFKQEYLTDMLSDMKLVDHQIGQLLVRINAKHPELKNEMLMIKKILADFIAKKRK
jgi:hypothetical protein